MADAAPLSPLQRLTLRTRVWFPAGRLRRPRETKTVATCARWTRGLALVLGIALGSLSCLWTPVAGAPPGVPPRAASTNDPASILFSSLIPRIEIRLDPASLEALRFSPRTYVRASLREGTNLLSNVALKLKGARGSFRPVDDRPALTINTDKFTGIGKFHGLDKFHLNNSVQDPTLMNEILCSELFLAAGVPTARATHARVIFNGRDLGFYVLKEGYDRTFLKRHFGQASGNLYDGGFLMDVNQHLERDSGDGPNDWSDLRELAAAASESDLERRKDRLESILDMDRFVTYAALEMLTCDWDGYLQNRNNYRLYRDPATGKFVFIPHGMDQMFWDVSYPVTPGVAAEGRRGRRGFRQPGMIGQQVFEVIEYQRRYLERMGELLDREFTAEWLGWQVTRIENRVREQVGESDPQFASYISGYGRTLRRHLAERARYARLQHTALMRRYRPE